jgi:GT2 family glycosyltransferase
MIPTTAVIPNWNGRRFLPHLLNSLVGQGFAGVLVVDNGSNDGSEAVAERWGAKLIRLGANHGFARAVNAGVAASATECVAILNNDVELFPDWLSVLTVQLENHPEIGFATGKIYKPSRDRLDGTFDLISRAACPWRAGNGRRDEPKWNVAQEIDLASMTATIFRRAVFDRVGYLDERFESYLEDVDFSIRCARLGIRGYYAPAAQSTHWGSATLGVWHRETVRRLARNQLYLMAKHYPRGWGLRLGWPVLVGQLLWGCLAARHGRFVPWLQGKWEGCRNFSQLRAQPGGAEVLMLLAEQERRLRQLLAGDEGWYWRTYFALT